MLLIAVLQSLKGVDFRGFGLGAYGVRLRAFCVSEVWGLTFKPG